MVGLWPPRLLPEIESSVRVHGAINCLIVQKKLAKKRKILPVAFLEILDAGTTFS